MEHKEGNRKVGTERYIRQDVIDRNVRIERIHKDRIKNGTERIE
jgi:hypothetical protein